MIVGRRSSSSSTSSEFSLVSGASPTEHAGGRTSGRWKPTYSADMHLWSMRFKNQDAERKYVATTVIYGTVRLEAFNLIAFSYLFAEFFFNTYSVRSEGLLFARWSTTGRSVYNISWLTLFISHVSICLFMRLVHWQYIKTALPGEYVFSAGVVVAALLFPFINRWRVVELFGSDRELSFPTGDGGISANYVDDSITISAVLAMLGYISLIIPMRFHISLGLMTLFFFSLVWSTLVTGSPKENNYVYNFIVMGCFMVAIIVIKRDLDRSNRMAFISESNARKSASEIDKLLQLSNPRYQSPLSRLELAREKLITLGKCIALDKSSDFSKIRVAQTISGKDDVKLKLINEVLGMISFPYNLLSRMSLTSTQTGTIASASHNAIHRFMTENFYKSKDDSTIEKLIWEDKQSDIWNRSATSSTLVAPLDLNNDIDIGKENLRKFCRDWLCNLVEIYHKLDNRTMTTLLPPILSRFTKDCDDELRAFFHGLSSKYQANSYHSEAHACQVVSHGACLTRILGVSSESSNIECMSFMVAAAAHDVGHFGRNNRFCVVTKHEVALTYNDKSVLENMHASITFRLLGNVNMCFTQNFREGEFRLFRSLVIDLILATDMSENADAMSAFRMRVGSEGFNLNQETDRRHCYRMIIKAADIGHGTLGWNEHSVWSSWLCAEFFEQGDEERKLNIPISALCDRHDTDFPVCQQGFLRYCCMPLFQCFIAVEKAVAATKNANNEDGDESKGFLTGDSQRNYAVCAYEQVLISGRESPSSNADNITAPIKTPDAIVQQIESNTDRWKKLEEAKIEEKKANNVVAPAATGDI